MGFFLDQCQASPAGCAFAADDTRAKFDEFMSRLLDGPITVDLPPGPIGPGGPATITYAFVIDNLRGALQFPPIWSALAELLEAAFEAGGAAATPAAATAPPADASAAIPDGYDNSHDALLAVACSETDNPHAASRWAQEAVEADRDTPYFGADWTWLSLPCATWPAHDHDRATGPFGVPTANPLLFVNARFDAASPYERAVRVAGSFPSARLLTVEGAAHPASFVPNECVAETVGRYLVEQVLPAAGAVCQSEFAPFGPVE